MEGLKYTSGSIDIVEIGNRILERFDIELADKR